MLAAVAVVALIVAVALVARRANEPSGDAYRAPAPEPPTPAAYVGRQVCAECHADQAQRWQGSHHDLAMQVADDRTALGNFDGTSFTYAGVTSYFYRRGGKPFVYTDGPDGAMREYAVAYTFGVDPLQQYLVPMPGGRYQALSIAWDSRPAASGGQRWFHLYPNDTIGHDDVLHWTRPSQNWNDRCARCHSTDLRKGYRLDGDRYETTWSELDVSCEACHGPASTHVAKARAKASPAEIRAALGVRLGDPEPATWVFEGPSGIAHRTPARTSHEEVETCAPCHTRRGEIGDAAVPGRPLLDGYRPALLETGLYFADGQIEDEVYEYGSFLQSAMFRAGVTCSDCHDPHSLRLRADGNALCARCHLPAKFDTPEHHFHPVGSAGAQCVACHMPARTYMVIDERRDHSFRVPRPDLSATLGVPNTCTGCHADRTPDWAAAVIAARPGAHRLGTSHYAQAIAAGRKGAADADGRLASLASDATAPAIVRATAVSLLGNPANPLVQTALRGAGNGDGLLRSATVDAVRDGDPRAAAPVVAPLLTDPLRAVRLGAARDLAGAPAGTLTPDQQAALARGIDEYRAAELANADRPESHMNLALLDARLGRMADAERELDTAIRLGPYFVPARVNLADLYRVQGRDAEGEQVLRAAIAIAPGVAEGHHALGLLLVRQRRTGEALAELGRAAALAPDNARYAYVLGVALHSTGQTARALQTLATAHATRPDDRDLLVALATISRDAGDRDGARRYADELATLTPWDADARKLQHEMAE